MAKFRPGAITVKPGDTLTGIIARIYGIPGSKAKPHLGEFYLEDKHGKLVSLVNVNRIVAGEILYHRPNGLTDNNGLKSLRPGSGGRKASDGVQNPRTFKVKDREKLKRIHQLVGQAKHQIKAALHALTHLNEPAKKEQFEISFSMNANAQNIAANYRKMLSVADAVEWHEQTVRPVTTVSGSDVFAFAVFNHFIAIYPPNFYAEGVNDRKRVEVIIHELAHYAFDAGHAVEELPGGGFAIGGSGANAAEAYAGFAMESH